MNKNIVTFSCFSYDLFYIFLSVIFYCLYLAPIKISHFKNKSMEAYSFIKLSLIPSSSPMQQLHFARVVTKLNLLSVRKCLGEKHSLVTMGV